MNTKNILKHLDSPVRILSFTVNDLVGYISPFFIGALFDSLLIIPICGLIIIYFAKKLLRKMPQFYFFRYLYWALPTKRYSKITHIAWPPSSKRMWVK